MQNELGGGPRWGTADTYDNTRRLTKWAKSTDAGNGKDHRGGFRNTRNNYRCANCDGRAEDLDKENGFAGDWDTYEYHVDRPLNPVNLNANNPPSIEIEFGYI